MLAAARRFPLALVVATALAFLVAWLARLILSGTGDAAAAVLLHWPRERLVSSAFRALLASLALPVVLYAWHRLARGVRVWVPLALVTLWVGSKYLESLRDNDHFGFAPGIVTLPPNRAIEDHNPNRPQYPYLINSQGFREPDWTRPKAPGTVRGVVIGDSYVFGIGVPVDETLPRHLGDALRTRHPGKSVEVINLGMPGNNFASYVDLYEAARGALDFDFAVLCLTMPNDLSQWDWAREWHQAHRVSLYSFARFVLDSSVASALWGTQLLEVGIQPAAVSAFRNESQRLLAIRTRTGEVPLVVFTYRFQGQPVDDAFQGMTNATLLSGVGDESDFIPGDGHPNAQGNRHFAPPIADALDSLHAVP